LLDAGPGGAGSYIYIPKDDNHVRRSYACVRALQLFRDEPEVVVTAADQITDVPPK
jgi:hypothetical protein